MESTNELMDSIFTGESPEKISDKIKEILYNKTSETIDMLTPSIGKSMFGGFEEG